MRRTAALHAALLLGIAAAAGACAGGAAATPRITPGTPVQPRVLNVIAREWTFTPAIVDLVPGETVQLHVVNGGTEVHEAVFGGPDVQDAWERAEAAAADPPPGPTPVVSVPPQVSGLRVVVESGQRADRVWTVPTQGAGDPWMVGCHIPGHLERGMIVPVRWIGPDGLPLDSGGLTSPSP